MTTPLPSAPFFVVLNHAEKRLIADVWPLYLPDALPTIPVPLLPGDDDILLNLQQAFTATYDLLGLDLEVNYTEPPEIPLSATDMPWVRALLNQ